MKPLQARVNVTIGIKIGYVTIRITERASMQKTFLSLIAGLRKLFYLHYGMLVCQLFRSRNIGPVSR